MARAKKKVRQSWVTTLSMYALQTGYVGIGLFNVGVFCVFPVFIYNGIVEHRDRLQNTTFMKEYIKYSLVYLSGAMVLLFNGTYNTE